MKRKNVWKWGAIVLLLLLIIGIVIFINNANKNEAGDAGQATEVQENGKESLTENETQDVVKEESKEENEEENKVENKEENKVENKEENKEKNVLSQAVGELPEPQEDLSYVNDAEYTLNLSWPTDMSEFPEWVRKSTDEELERTINAINAEYSRQIASGFDMGDFQAFGMWGGYPTVQLNGGDHIDNPWGHANRKWGKIVVPYVGMAFSVKAYMSKSDDASVPLANELVWKNPSDNSERIYQVFSDFEKHFNTDGTDQTGWGYHPGSGASGNCVEAFRKAYAQSAWYNESMKVPYNLGCIHQNAKKEGNIVYQEFLGNDSDGRSPEPSRGYDKDYGISYIVAANTSATQAYIITDDMFTAWTTTWTDNQNGKFTASGAPLGNQYVNEQGNIAQDFENFTIVLEEDVFQPVILMAKGEISNFRIEGGETLQNGTDILVFVPAGSSADMSFRPEFDLSEGAVVDKASGELQNFSEPVEYAVTSETGDLFTYYVSVVEIEKGNISDEAEREATAYMEKFMLLNEEVTFADEETVQYLEQEFWNLTDVAKYLSKDKYESLVQVREQLAELGKKTKALKVACVGDSITDFSPNYVTPLADQFNPAVIGFHSYGVGGYCLGKNSDWSYWVTQKFTQSQELQPDIVTIMLGTNDSKPRNWVERDVKNSLKDDAVEMINVYRALDSHPYVIILTAPAVYKEYDTINDPYVCEVNEILKEVAEEQDCILVDTYAATANDPSNTRDGVHPTEQGASLMADVIADAIRGRFLNTSISKLMVGEMEMTPESQYIEITLTDGQAIPTVDAEVEYGVVVIEHAATESEPYTLIKVTSELSNYAKRYMVKFIK